MFLNYLKTALRNLLRNKLDSFLTLSGIALGLALSVLIIFHIREELSYDRHFSKADRLFRVTNTMKRGGTLRHWATTAPLIPEYMARTIPEIENSCRLFPLPSMILSYTPANREASRYKSSSGFFADESSIDMFDFEFIAGDPQTALAEINSIVLTETTASRMFAKENPLGKMVSFDSETKEASLLKVTGIIRDIPGNTHFDFDFLVSFPTFYAFLRNLDLEDLAQAKTWAALYNYVLLKDASLINAARAKLPDFTADYLQGMGSREEILARIQFHLQPIVDIHLHSNLEQEFEANSDMTFIMIFAAIAFFILLIAAVNYINISIAQSIRRMHEIGIRKVLGVQRSRLIQQIMGESFIYIFLAVVVSIFLIELFLPFYNMLADKQYLLISIFQPTNILIFLGIILLFGTLASIYPAVLISGLNPVQSIKGIRDPISSVARTRKGLVIAQFAISIFMIFATIITLQQMKYLKNKKLGFDKENIIAVQLNNDLQQLAIQNPETMKNELLKNAAISAVSVVSNIPGERLSVEPLHVQGLSDNDERVQFRFLRVDKDYPDLLDLRLISGENFQHLSGNRSAYLLNQTAARALRIDDPVGRAASSVFGTEGEILGVVEDFHFASLHNAIEPLVIEHFPVSHPMQTAVSAYLLVKIRGTDLQAHIRSIEKDIHKIAPNSLFTYTFLDQELDRLYESEQRMSNLFQAFALCGIFISCLGLFGISSYSVQLRVKEIGIRKTLGASLLNIIQILSRSYLVWILAANLIALPLGWIYVRNWLQNFAYRTPIGISAFLITLLISMGLAWLTVSYHAIRAAIANPIESLRYE